MWYVALGWHATECAQTSAILEFYIRFRFWPYHRSWHVILHQSAKSYPNRTTLSRKKLTSCRFWRWWISAILDFRGPMIGSLKSPCTTSYRSSIDTIAPTCLVFEKIAFLHFGDRQTQTNKQMDNIDALSRSRCRELRYNLYNKLIMLLFSLPIVCYLYRSHTVPPWLCLTDWPEVSWSCTSDRRTLTWRLQRCRTTRSS